ncbi:hypothetical protein GCM10010435_05270 [Winogradskya consettensis]|uniref:Uncharacterized protein n=1 Tax=Winogradskya consettensis TaxID=113560 RepID=A0A919VXN5_9ACTN|nr:hypothetical protein Aco04nite_66100 [Actinoplanes consettensis]
MSQANLSCIRATYAMLPRADVPPAVRVASPDEPASPCGLSLEMTWARSFEDAVRLGLDRLFGRGRYPLADLRLAGAPRCGGVE